MQKILPEKYSDKELDKFHYLIHLIYEQKILYKNPEEYISLKAEYLRKIIRDYNHYRDILISQNIVECDGHYIKGKKSMGYRLMSPYSEVKHTQIEIKNKIILKNIEKWQKQRLPTTEIHCHLYKFLESIKIDSVNALKSIKDLNIIEHNISEFAINKFLNKEFFFISDQYGRVHTNITSLKSSLRQFITYKGEKLYNVDIINSQPLFLLLIPFFTTSIRCTFSDFIEVGELDVFKYKQLAESGELYEYLINNMDQDDYLAEQTNEYDKKQFKENFFRETLFGTEVSRVFWELFPTVAKAIADIKKDDYRSLAWMMQRAESKLIITQICGRLMKEHPDYFISTIHDSILTTEEHVDEIKLIMEQEFKKLGLCPSIRINPA